jgi:hypothetical protein
MGLSKQITVICDYSGCKENNGNPAVLSWNETAVANGQAEAPELSKYLVLFNQGTRLFSFCCQLHASMYFLPPGYEALQKKIVEMASKNPPMIEQGDGVREDNPVNGQCQKCGHDWDVHNKYYGCREENCECGLEPKESE